ncbi:MAG: hypothetical protein ACXVFT_18730 [Solirubrobacteraceae bacterium]
MRGLVERRRRRGERACGAEGRGHRGALLGQVARLRGRGDDEELALLAGDARLAQVEARARERIGVDLPADHVLVERLDRLRRRGRRCGRGQAGDE